jgi:purine-binding chemotaxis protein CheW
MLNQTDNRNAYILFTLNETTYAIHSTAVQQMEMLEQVTPVPNALPFVEGVTFVRGQVVPLINLRARFGFPRQQHDLRTRLIVIDHNGRRVGLIVDTARDFITIPEESVQPAPEAIAGLSGHYLSGIATLGERLVLILDVAEILNLAGTVAEAVTEEVEGYKVEG